MFFAYSSSDPSIFKIQYGVTEISEDDYNTIPVKDFVYHEYFTGQPGLFNDVAILKVRIFK